MNKDQAGGADKVTSPKTPERAGAMIVGTDPKDKGAPRQAEGRLQRASNDVKEALRKTRHE